MKTIDFLSAINFLSKENLQVKLYPYSNREKLYGRFVKKVIVPKVIRVVTDGWLEEIYHSTNGIDLSNYYIIPFNNYFNPKPLSFEEFYLDWIINQDNPNEIIGRFCAFMTDNQVLIGYLEDLVDSQGNNFIGIAKGRPVNDVIVIASSIYFLFDYIVEQLKKGKTISFPEDENFWRSRDPELDLYYDKNDILKYKLEYLYQEDSANYEKYKIEE